MANIKFFQQNSSLQACSSKTGLRDNATARQNNYRAIRGVNFTNSPAQHLFAARQSSLSTLQTSPLFPAAVAGWVTVNNTLQMCSNERLGKMSQSICQIPLQADFGLNPILFGAIVACMGCPRRGESPAPAPIPIPQSTVIQRASPLGAAALRGAELNPTRITPGALPPQGPRGLRAPLLIPRSRSWCAPRAVAHRADTPARSTS